MTKRLSGTPFSITVSSLVTWKPWCSKNGCASRFAAVLILSILSFCSIFNAAVYNFKAMHLQAKGGEVNSEYHTCGDQSELFLRSL